MDSKSKSSSASLTYEDFQPLTDWRREEQADAVVINLPGYEKQHLKILLDNTGKMKISGARPRGPGNTWQRFQVDLQVPQASDLNAIRAKFDKGILTVTMPKTTPPSKTTTTTTAPAPEPGPGPGPAPAPSSRKPDAKESVPPPPPPAAAASTKPTDDGAAKAKEPPPTTPPEEATAPLICRRKSADGFLYRHRKAAMGTVLAAVALTAGIYVLYKLGVFRGQDGK